MEVTMERSALSAFLRSHDKRTYRRSCFCAGHCRRVMLLVVRARAMPTIKTTIWSSAKSAATFVKHVASTQSLPHPTANLKGAREGVRRSLAGIQGGKYGKLG